MLHTELKHLSPSPFGGIQNSGYIQNIFKFDQFIFLEFNKKSTNSIIKNITVTTSLNLDYLVYTKSSSRFVLFRLFERRGTTFGD